VRRCTFKREGIDHVTISRTYEGGHVTTDRVAADGKATKTVVDHAPAAFDFFNGQDALLLACLPLKVGYEGSFVAIDETTDQSKLAPFKVVREEYVQAGIRGKIKTWVVVQDLPGEFTSTFWISPNPPYYIRLVVTYPDNRYSFTFDMI
jgi:hypothetical protein